MCTWIGDVTVDYRAVSDDASLLSISLQSNQPISKSKCHTICITRSKVKGHPLDKIRMFSEIFQHDTPPAELQFLRLLTDGVACWKRGKKNLISRKVNDDGGEKAEGGDLLTWWLWLELNPVPGLSFWQHHCAAEEFLIILISKHFIHTFKLLLGCSYVYSASVFRCHDLLQGIVRNQFYYTTIQLLFIYLEVRSIVLGWVGS